MKSLICRLLLLLTFSLGAAKSVRAGTIFLSGDVNIGNPINGSSRARVNPGNATFFTNILGDGTKILIQDELYGDSERLSIDAINAFYSSMSGVTTRLDTSGQAITTELLAGVDLYFSIMPGNAYSASEVSALSLFLAGSGSAFFSGGSASFTVSNSRINAALSSLGSSMMLGNGFLDAGFNTTTNINVDPFTAGVTSFTYALTNFISDGRSLVRTRNGQTIIAYDVIPPSTVPEPTSLAIWSLGTITLVCIVLRRQSRMMQPMR